MTSLPILFVVSALAASSGQVVPTAERSTPSGAASLSFVSNSPVLVGTVYGIDAIDAQRQAYGHRLSADISAGRRTVWYSCPNALHMSDGSRITFDFVAGAHYELVCRPAKDAVIRPAEDC